jgi:aminoglycoside 3-N-acetyltransferase
MKFNNYIKNYLVKSGINKDDKILLHSDLRLLFKDLYKEKFIFTVQNILDVFLDYISPQGTLILPTFNFDFCNKNIKLFSYLNSKSISGVLSETARINNKLNRTWHPVFSFVLLGNVPWNELEKKNYSAYGKSSIFHWLTENNGKIGIINLTDQYSMSYYHYAEEMLNVDYRKHKKFTGIYENKNMDKSEATCQIFVRKSKNKIITDVNNMSKILHKKKLYKGVYNKFFMGFRTILCKDVFAEVKKVTEKKKNLGILYRIIN